MVSSMAELERMHEELSHGKPADMLIELATQIERKIALLKKAREIWWHGVWRHKYPDDVTVEQINDHRLAGLEKMYKVWPADSVAHMIELVKTGKFLSQDGRWYQEPLDAMTRAVTYLKEKSVGSAANAMERAAFESAKGRDRYKGPLGPLYKKVEKFASQWYPPGTRYR